LFKVGALTKAQLLVAEPTQRRGGAALGASGRDTDNPNPTHIPFSASPSPPVRGKYGLKKGLRGKKDFVYGLKKSVRGFFNPNSVTLGRKGSP
jgi:hypothetical protein